MRKRKHSIKRRHYGGIKIPDMLLAKIKDKNGSEFIAIVSKITNISDGDDEPVYSVSYKRVDNGTEGVIESSSEEPTVQVFAQGSTDLSIYCPKSSVGYAW
jgi:hypothetical protein